MIVLKRMRIMKIILATNENKYIYNIFIHLFHPPMKVTQGVPK